MVTFGQFTSEFRDGIDRRVHLAPQPLLRWANCRNQLAECHLADDQYIHDSIMLPNKQIAAGYQPRMPPFGNVLDEEQVAQLEAYIRSLGAEEDK